MIKKRYDKAGPAVAEAMKKRGFDAYYVSTAEEARAKALELIPEGSTVSWGGSVTIDQIGLKQAVIEGGYEVINRDEAKTPEERTEFMRKGLTCDVFLMSANAVSEDGQMVNIDGNGNRVAALCFGPKEVIVIAGMNKVVANVDDGIRRVRTQAVPPNCVRLSCDTPCAKTGKCAECIPNSICANIVITRKSMVPNRIKVILIGETLGY